LIETSANPWRDHFRLSDIALPFICTACGTRGADIKPDFYWDKPGLLSGPLIGNKKPAIRGGLQWEKQGDERTAVSEGRL